MQQFENYSMLKILILMYMLLDGKIVWFTIQQRIGQRDHLFNLDWLFTF